MKEFFDRVFNGGLSQSFFSVPFSTFTWRDALDILVLTAIFFVVYRYVRDRRSGRLLLGAAIVVGVYAISVMLGMYTLRYLFGSFFGYSLLVIVIIFHPELRALLERAGTVSFGRLKKLAPESRHRSMLPPDDVETLVQATKTLAYGKTGAIIAIERKLNVTPFFNNIGKETILGGALISERLLLNIFYGNNPMHDGAVIVRDGRIYAAGCVLERLASDSAAVKGVGTRHRAALGLAQDSDAVVIVVSEQTGHISLACDGKMSRNLSSVELRRRLIELLSVQKNDSRKEGKKGTK